MSDPAGSPLVQLDGVRFSHPGQRVPLSIPSLAIGAGERVAVIGPSGSGKTTLLHLIAGILAPSAGRISVAGIDLTQESAPKRRRFRLEQIGLVFQEFELLESLTVRENIELPFLIDRRRRSPESRQRLVPLAERLGIGEYLARRPRQLSHGERQRVAIARALIAEPARLLADEPTGNLDPKTGSEVLDSMVEEAKRLGTTVIMVTHDHSRLDRLDRTLDLATFVAPGDAA